MINSIVNNCPTSESVYEKLEMVILTGDFKALKHILRESIILPKMIHQSRYRFSGNAGGADK